MALTALPHPGHVFGQSPVFLCRLPFVDRQDLPAVTVIPLASNRPAAVQPVLPLRAV
jgi:hypothetical protein